MEEFEEDGLVGDEAGGDEVGVELEKVVGG